MARVCIIPIIYKVPTVDRKIEKSRWNSKRLMTIGGIAGLALLIAASLFFTSGKSKLNVDTERLTISEVTKGPFREYIPVNGVVLPITTIYLDALEGGRVEQRFVEDGFDSCLERKPVIKTKIKKIDGEVEAHLIALSCGKAPEGFSKWSLRLLADKMVELKYVDDISYETIRKALKKTS